MPYSLRNYDTLRDLDDATFATIDEAVAYCAGQGVARLAKDWGALFEASLTGDTIRSVAVSGPFAGRGTRFLLVRRDTTAVKAAPGPATSSQKATPKQIALLSRLLARHGNLGRGIDFATLTTREASAEIRTYLNTDEM